MSKLNNTFAVHSAKFDDVSCDMTYIVFLSKDFDECEYSYSDSPEIFQINVDRDLCSIVDITNSDPSPDRPDRTYYPNILLAFAKLCDAVESSSSDTFVNFVPDVVTFTVDL